LLRFYLGIEVM
jgi:hypothetical protein